MLHPGSPEEWCLMHLLICCENHILGGEEARAAAGILEAPILLWVGPGPLIPPGKRFELLRADGFLGTVALPGLRGGSLQAAGLEERGARAERVLSYRTSQSL